MRPTKEEADRLVRQTIDPLSPIHDRSLNLSEVEESVKKFYPDATMIYDAGSRLTPPGKGNRDNITDCPKGVHFEDRNGSKLIEGPSVTDLIKVASVPLLQE